MQQFTNQAVQKQSLDFAYEAAQQNTGIDFARTFFDLFRDVLAGIFYSLLLFLLLFSIGFFLYLFIKLILSWKSGGAKLANEEISKDVRGVIGFFKNIFIGTGNGISAFFGFFWKRKLLFGSLILIILVMGLAQRYRLVRVLRVHPGEMAIDISAGKELKPGVHLIFPLWTDYILSHVARYQFEIPEITADSSDLQDVVIHANLSFHLDQEKLTEFYTREGAISIWDTANAIVTPRAIEKIKNIIQNYRLLEVHEKQIEIKELAMEEIEKSLKIRGIILDDLNFVNIRIASKFVEILGDREVSDEKLKLEKAELERQKIQTEKELELAERERAKQIINAKGIAESNRLIKQQGMTKEMLELKKIENTKLAIEKWNGEVPQQVGGSFSVGE